MLVTVLQQDFGVHYNLDRMRDIDFTRSKDLFIHGMIDDSNGGTCVSMPIIYVVVGRRLGYPLKLALAKEHVFARWDGQGQRFNIEATNQGMDTFDDSYYHTWPKKMSPAEIKSGRYLRSLTRSEELALCLSNRAHCLLDNGKPIDAQVAYAQAHRLAPDEPSYFVWLIDNAIRADRSIAAQIVSSAKSRIAQVKAEQRRKTQQFQAGMRVADAINAENRRRQEAELRRIDAINAENLRRLQQPTPGLPKQYRPGRP